MLKSLMFYLMAAVALIRTGSSIYLLATGDTSLPIVVFVLTGITVLYALYLTVKRIFGVILLRQLSTYYIFQCTVVLFNLIFVALTVPTRITWIEIAAMGSLLDLLVGGVLIYYSLKQVRNHYLKVTKLTAEEFRAND
ncbi:MAG: hypothetical protein ACK5LX_01410 [Oscillospiraceae bacterium]